jgi:hypothetical protein
VLLLLDADDHLAAEPQPRHRHLVVEGVERDIPVPVDRERVRHDLGAADLRGRQLERRELLDIDRPPRVGQRGTTGQRRGDRREEVTAVERRGDRSQPVRRLGDLDRLDDAAEMLARGQQQAVVGPDEQPAVLGTAQRHRAPPAADLRVDDREVDAHRGEGQRPAQDQRAGAHVMTGDAVREVDHAHVGRDPRHDRVADPDEVVLMPVVAQEGDDHDSGGYAPDMAERSDAPLANDSGAGSPPNDDPGALEGAPSGLPEGIEESEPLGTSDEDPEGEGDTPRGEDAQPGIQRGEPDVSG